MRGENKLRALERGGGKIRSVWGFSGHVASSLDTLSLFETLSILFFLPQKEENISRPCSSRSMFGKRREKARAQVFSARAPVSKRKKTSMERGREPPLRLPPSPPPKLAHFDSQGLAIPPEDSWRGRRAVAERGESKVFFFSPLPHSSLSLSKKKKELASAQPKCPSRAASPGPPGTSGTRYAWHCLAVTPRRSVRRWKW